MFVYVKQFTLSLLLTRWLTRLEPRRKRSGNVSKFAFSLFCSCMFFSEGSTDSKVIKEEMGSTREEQKGMKEGDKERVTAPSVTSSADRAFCQF